MTTYVTELQPYEIRDKILGALAKTFPLARTRDEIATDSGVDPGLVNRELVHLIQAEYVNWYGQEPDDPRTTEFLPVLVATPKVKFSISSKGREYLDGKSKPTSKPGLGAKVTIKEISPNPDIASDLLREARQWQTRAEDSRTKGDNSGAVVGGLKAIELAAKSLFPLAGFVYPKDHAVGLSLGEVIRRLTGDEWAVKLTKPEVARLAWLSEVSAALQEIAEYGFLEAPTNAVMTETDAETWTRYGKESIQVVDRLLALLSGGQLRFRASPGR